MRYVQLAFLDYCRRNITTRYRTCFANILVECKTIHAEMLHGIISKICIHTYCYDVFLLCYLIE